MSSPLLEMAERINSIDHSVTMYVDGPSSGTICLAYDTQVARVILLYNDLLVIVAASADENTHWRTEFSSPEDAAIFIMAKFSAGLQLHEHVWRISSNHMVQPAYTVGCTVPGCPAELFIPFPWGKREVEP